MAGGSKTQKLTEDHQKEARIEIIPLIDVIFFLLAPFVLFTLQVSDNGNYYWNQEHLTTLSEVEYRLGNYVSDEPNPRVLLASDDLAKYGDVIQVLDVVRSVEEGNPTKVQVSFETVYRPTGR